MSIAHTNRTILCTLTNLNVVGHNMFLEPMQIPITIIDVTYNNFQSKP